VDGSHTQFDARLRRMISSLQESRTERVMPLRTFCVQSVTNNIATDTPNE
jgi:hypothetical protein